MNNYTEWLTDGESDSSILQERVEMLYAELAKAQQAATALAMLTEGDGSLQEDIGLCAAAVVLAYHRKTHDHILADDDTFKAALRVERYLGRR